jgi:RecJ-like exonuclease
MHYVACISSQQHCNCCRENGNASVESQLCIVVSWNKISDDSEETVSKTVWAEPTYQTINYAWYRQFAQNGHVCTKATVQGTHLFLKWMCTQCNRCSRRSRGASQELTIPQPAVCKTVRKHLQLKWQRQINNAVHLIPGSCSITFLLLRIC